MVSIVPSERLQRELEEIVAGAGEENDPIEAIGRLGARLILQQALEEELTEFLGRERYEQRGQPVSHRNGYEPLTVRTTAGPLELERPRVRNASALDFASAIVGKGVTRTHALEALVIASFLRGLSVRDVEAALDLAGARPKRDRRRRGCGVGRQQRGRHDLRDRPADRRPTVLQAPRYRSPRRSSASSTHGTPWSATDPTAQVCRPRVPKRSSATAPERSGCRRSSTQCCRRLGSAAPSSSLDSRMSDARPPQSRSKTITSMPVCPGEPS